MVPIASELAGKGAATSGTGVGESRNRITSVREGEKQTTAVAESSGTGTDLGSGPTLSVTARPSAPTAAGPNSASSRASPDRPLTNERTPSHPHPIAQNAGSRTAPDGNQTPLKLVHPGESPSVPAAPTRVGQVPTANVGETSSRPNPPSATAPTKPELTVPTRPDRKVAEDRTVGSTSSPATGSGKRPDNGGDLAGPKEEIEQSFARLFAQIQRSQNWADNSQQRRAQSAPTRAASSVAPPRASDGPLSVVASGAQDGEHRIPEKKAAIEPKREPNPSVDDGRYLPQSRQRSESTQPVQSTRIDLPRSAERIARVSRTKQTGSRPLSAQTKPDAPGGSLPGGHLEAAFKRLVDEFSTGNAAPTAGDADPTRSSAPRAQTKISRVSPKGTELNSKEQTIQNLPANGGPMLPPARPSAEAEKGRTAAPLEDRFLADLLNELNQIQLQVRRDSGSS